VRDFLEYAQGEIAGLPDSAHVICGFGLAYRPSGRSERQFEHYMKRQVLMFLLLDTIKGNHRSENRSTFCARERQQRRSASSCVSVPRPYSDVLCGLALRPHTRARIRTEATEQPYRVGRCGRVHRHPISVEARAGKKPELDPSRFGRVFWYGFNKRGEPRRANQVGFPWDEFFI